MKVKNKSFSLWVANLNHVIEYCTPLIAKKKAHMVTAKCGGDTTTDANFISMQIYFKLEEDFCRKCFCLPCSW